jgi:folate-binding protein YgfZ
LIAEEVCAQQARGGRSRALSAARRVAYLMARGEIMTAGLHATDRVLLRLSGADVRDFLQNLVTNDVDGIDRGLVYAALLSPQGKYLFDFFLVPDGDAVLVDVKADRATALAQRLGLYKLRADVVIAPADLGVVVGTGEPPAGVKAYPDPRHPEFGWRAYVTDPAALAAGIAPLAADALTARRVALGVPETGIELLPDESYILEMGFERLHGVDFRKGCYVGQEVTARMKHKTDLRKGLARVRVTGTAPPPGTEIRAGDRVAGTLFSTAGGTGLAHLRFDRVDGAPLIAGAAELTPEAKDTGGGFA